jgi:hypothetical protein
LDHKQRFFQGRQVKNCLPKGYRHNSAPSRFVNYDTLGGCSGIHSEKPWKIFFWISESVLFFLNIWLEDKNLVFLPSFFVIVILYIIYLLQFWGMCIDEYFFDYMRVFLFVCNYHL